VDLVLLFQVPFAAVGTSIHLVLPSSLDRFFLLFWHFGILDDSVRGKDSADVANSLSNLHGVPLHFHFMYSAWIAHICKMHFVSVLWRFRMVPIFVLEMVSVRK
jgi:hypothetical protein